MAVLVPGRTVATREPTLLVENALAPGVYVFRLTVLDDSRNESAPAEFTVQVQRVLTDTTVVRPTLRTPIVPPLLRPGVPR